MILLSDARYALRLLRKDRWLAAVAIGALGLGIAVNNTQFTIVEGYRLRGLPIARADRVAVSSACATERRSDGSDGVRRRSPTSGVRPPRSTTMAASATAPVSLGDATQAAESATAAFMSVPALHLLDARRPSAATFGMTTRHPGDSRSQSSCRTACGRRADQRDAAIVGRSDPRQRVARA